MSRTDRRLGNFSHNSVGKAHRVVDPGWRQFMMTDSECTIEDPLGLCVDGTGSIVETSGATVVTYDVNHSGGSDHPIDSCVAFKPLRDPNGVVCTFGKPFTLRVVLELISISGGYGASVDTNYPHISVGLTQNTSNVDTAGNKFFGVGYQLRCVGSEDIAVDGWGLLTYRNASNNNRVTDHANSPDTTDHPILSAMFYVGPDLDSADNSYVSWMYMSETGDSGDPYDALYSNPQTKTQNVNQFGVTEGNKVMMYVAIGDKSQSTDVNSTPAVVTFKVHYLVAAAPEGWGGTGAA